MTVATRYAAFREAIEADIKPKRELLNFDHILEQTRAIGRERKFTEGAARKLPRKKVDSKQSA